MFTIDLTGRRALVAGVADDAGYGFAIAKALVECGATVVVGTWPPTTVASSGVAVVMSCVGPAIFAGCSIAAANSSIDWKRAAGSFSSARAITRSIPCDSAGLIERGKMDASRRLSNGDMMEFERIYPLDAAFDTMADVPEDVRTNKRYANAGDFTIGGVADRLVADFGDRPLDIVVHSLANGPEVKKPLMDTSRSGYLTAVGVSAYSLVSFVQRFGPLLRPRASFLSLTYMASERVIPGYGGGM